MKFRTLDHGSEEYEAALQLRREVLRWPLGLDFTPEQIALEAEDLHLAAYDSGELRAVLVLTPLDSETVKMRQVAVAPNLQRGGVGTGLVRYSEEVAVERGFREMVMSARETAVPFYQRLGYVVEGEPYEEVTLPHRRMRKRLR